MTRDEFMIRMAEQCRCCPECEVVPPCDGCCAGGICDHSRCTCGEDDEPYYDDEQQADGETRNQRSTEVLTMSANTETTGAPEGYRQCSKKACSRWTYAPGACWTCCTPKGPDSVITAAMVASDWTPPIAAPAAHIERRKGQVWRHTSSGYVTEWVLVEYRGDRWGCIGSMGGMGGVLLDACWEKGMMTLLADAPPEPEAPKQWKEHARCGFPIVSSNREAAVTAVGKHQATCEKCSVHEAPKAAPVCTNGRDCLSPTAPVLVRVLRDERQPMCDICYLDLETNLGKMMRGESTGKPYAGPERLPKPQLAADWVEDCLPTVWR